jgi:hypothetical protein
MFERDYPEPLGFQKDYAAGWRTSRSPIPTSPPDPAI